MDDVREMYGGEGKFFLTGASAGGHLTFAMLFQHPEKLRGVAPVVSNWTGSVSIFLSNCLTGRRIRRLSNWKSNTWKR